MNIPKYTMEVWQNFICANLSCLIKYELSKITDMNELDFFWQPEHQLRTGEVRICQVELIYIIQMREDQVN